MIKLLITSFLLGIGLAMDACAVSMANGLKNPKMKVNKILLIALMFGLFQGLMPLLGYSVGSQILGKIEWTIPYIALVILTLVGINMIREGISDSDEDSNDNKELTFKLITIQAVATSIDALSVGFTISNYKIKEALICTMIITLVTFIICFYAVFIGKKCGDKLGHKAVILGGIILILIGLEIFITGVFL
jgi:putative Mn2+ efflux pump MntP